jgi:hypothetical protein
MFSTYIIDVLLRKNIPFLLHVLIILTLSGMAMAVLKLEKMKYLNEYGHEIGVAVVPCCDVQF